MIVILKRKKLNLIKDLGYFIKCEPPLNDDFKRLYRESDVFIDFWIRLDIYIFPLNLFYDFKWGRRENNLYV